jgi:hypothetical protein
VAFTLNGLDLTSGRATLLRSGVWHVDAVLVEALELAEGASVQLVLGDLVLVGTALPGGTWAGSSSYTIAGGAGGWAKTAPARPYRNDAGISLAEVVQDLAATVGEQLVVEAGADRTLGPAWTRIEGLAASALREVVGSAWWVAADGVTHVGPRPLAPVPAGLAFTVERFDPMRRRAVLSANDDALAALCTPGATWSDPGVPGVFTTMGALLEMTASAVRIEVQG